MGAREVLLGLGLALVGAPLAVLSDLPRPWNFAIAIASAGLGLYLVWRYLRNDTPAANSGASGAPARDVPVPDARAAAENQLEYFRQQRSALELAARGSEGTIAVIDLSGNPPDKPLDIVDGANTYRLKFSSSGGDNVWVYGDDPSIRSLAVERFAQRGDIVDAPNLRTERGATSVAINQRVFAMTPENKAIKALVLSVRYYNAGDDRDEVRTPYRVYAPGEFLIPAL